MTGALRRGEVHVWCVALDDAPPHEDPSEMLSPEERLRLERLRLPRDRAAFARTRVALRRHLAAYTGCDPGRVDLAAGPRGKPFVAGPPAAVNVRFSVSHSDGLALLAFSLDRDVGVDVERLRSLPDVEDLARSVFTEGELAELHAAAEPDRSGVFFERWTRKEAVVKALGEGLAAMPSFSVRVGTAEDRVTLPAAPRSRDPAILPPACRTWRVRSLDVRDGYAAALALADSPRASIRVTVGRSSPHPAAALPR